MAAAAVLRGAGLVKRFRTPDGRAPEVLRGKEPDFKTHMIKNVERYLPKGQLGDVHASIED